VVVVVVVLFDGNKSFKADDYGCETTLNTYTDVYRLDACDLKNLIKLIIYSALTTINLSASYKGE